MPGFPAQLAFAMKLNSAIGLDESRAYFVARLLQGIVGTVCCALVYVLGRDLFDSSIGLIAAGISAVMPTLAVFSVELLSETPFAAMVLASLIGIERIVRSSTTNEHDNRDRGQILVFAVLSGVLIALACYVRPSWLLFAPFFAAVYFVATRKALSASFRVLVGATVIVAMLAALAPWAYRNHERTGHWIFTTLWAGPSLYDGLRPDATGDSDMRFYEIDPNVPKMTEYEVDRYFREKARAFARENPRRTVELAFIKLWRFWKPWPNAEEFRNPLYVAVVAASFIPLITFAGWGAWLSRDRFWALFLTAGPILYFSTIHMVFVSSLRYRLPVEYPLCVLTAMGVRKFFGILGRGPESKV